MHDYFFVEDGFACFFTFHIEYFLGDLQMRTFSPPHSGQQCIPQRSYICPNGVRTYNNWRHCDTIVTGIRGGEIASQPDWTH